MASELFCEVCNNLLVSSKSYESKFEFQCMRCKETRKATAQDSLRYTEQKADNLSKYSNILKNIVDDPMNPKMRKKCKKCPNDIIKFIRLQEHILVNQCPKCKYKWVGE